MPRYKEKPVFIDAVQWFKVGDHPEVLAVDSEWDEYLQVKNGATGMIIDADGCACFVFPGDYIVTDKYGEVSKCVSITFDQTYELV